MCGIAWRSILDIWTFFCYQQRLENMNREMLERFYAQAFAGDTFHYNRPLTKEEEARFEKLNRDRKSVV